MSNDDSQLKSAGSPLSNDDDQKQDDKSQNDIETAVEELMQDFDLDPEQAEKLKKLEDEGYDEEDALGQVMDA
jgi:hypothetical protein